MATQRGLDEFRLVQEPGPGSPRGKDVDSEAIDRLERDNEALRDFLLSVGEAAFKAADRLATEED